MVIKLKIVATDLKMRVTFLNNFFKINISILQAQDLQIYSAEMKFPCDSIT